MVWRAVDHVTRRIVVNLLQDALQIGIKQHYKILTYLWCGLDSNRLAMCQRVLMTIAVDLYYQYNENWNKTVLNTYLCDRPFAKELRRLLLLFYCKHFIKSKQVQMAIDHVPKSFDGCSSIASIIYYQCNDTNTYLWCGRQWTICQRASMTTAVVLLQQCNED